MANTTIKLKVEDENIVFTSSPPVFSGDVNTISANFEFGVNWDGLTKYAVFYRSIETPYSVALSNNECLVPHEVMETAGRMYIGVYGTSADGKIKTSEVVFYDIGTGVLTGSVPSSETLSMWQQILADMDSIKELGEDFDANLQAVQEAKEICKEAAETAGAVSGNINDLLACRIVESATGESVTVDDASGARLAGLKLYGKSVQNITKGKNLCSVANISITSGSQTVSLDEIPAGTYTISAVVTSTDTDANECLMMFYYTDSSTKEINIGRSTGTERKSVSVTFDKVVNKVRVYASTAHGTSSGDTASVNDLQIESGSTATAYEAYTDGQPSPTHPVPIESCEGVTVSVTGANILPPQEYSNYFINQSGTLLGKAPTNFSKIIENVPIGKLHIYLNQSLGKFRACVVNELPASGAIPIDAVLADYRTHLEIDVTEPKQILIISIVDDVTKIMVQLESEQQEYAEPTEWQELATALNLYAVPVTSGGNYTDEDGQQWIADAADFETGKITRYTGMATIDSNTDFTTSNFTVSPSVAGRFGYKLSNAVANSKCLSNRFKSWQDGGDVTRAGYANVNNNNNNDGANNILFIVSSDIDTLAKLQEYCSNNSIDFIYQLNTPTTEDIPAEVMQAYKALHTNAGTTNVFTDSDPQAGIGLDYVADTKSYIDKRIDAIASTLINDVTGD